MHHDPYHALALRAPPPTLSRYLLTLSALLTDPNLLEGGVFMTWRGGQPVYHDDLEQGDAVVFHSERVHNVSAVMEGVRHSLVVELWEGADNENDRHS